MPLIVPGVVSLYSMFCFFLFCTSIIVVLFIGYGVETKGKRFEDIAEELRNRRFSFRM